jgi:hypothetical protein
MYIICLATDYDGTIAHDGAVDDATVEALVKLKRSGRRLVLVTGRELPDLIAAFPQLDLFDRVVAENGALLFNPGTKQERPLGPEPSPDLVAMLRAKNVAPLSVGRTIVATWEPNETVVLNAIRDLGLELQIVFNKGAVMVLPAGINKASGLEAALDDLAISAHNVVAVGDAENDHAFMQASGFAVAVSNALPALKEKADLITAGARGAGVAELIALLLEKDVQAFAPFKEHGLVEAAESAARGPVFIRPHGGGALIAGLSGGGKSSLATALIEGMLAVSVEDRPAAFRGFVGTLAEMHARTGRPHWVLVDEAHHVLPAERDVNASAAPIPLPTILVTVDPEAVAVHALAAVDDVFAVGTKPAETIEAFCKALSIEPPALPAPPKEAGQALLWRRRRAEPPEFVQPRAPAAKLERHTRKYAEGELGEDKSFYFRGPDNALSLRAQNLTIFLQMADGVDDATWLHHLTRHDVSRWMREAIKDEALAGEAEAVEDADGHPAESRRAIREAVERRYTAPAATGADLR